MLAVLAVACLLSWLGAKLRRAADQWAIAAELEEVGFQITSVSEFPKGQGFDMLNELLNPPGPSWMRETFGFEPFVEIGSVDADPARSGEINDDALALLARVPEVQMIGLSNTEITDQGLVHLKGLRNVWCLQLESTEITDAGMEKLKDMTKLQQIWLTGTKITDAGLVHLQGMSELSLLMLNNTDVTDAGLAHLKGSPDLLGIFAVNTQITEEGVRELRKTAPCVGVRLEVPQLPSDSGDAD